MCDDNKGLYCNQGSCSCNISSYWNYEKNSCGNIFLKLYFENSILYYGKPS